MSKGGPTDLRSYDANPLAAWLYRSLFDSIEVDETWLRTVREAKARGTVVYVLRNLSVVDFLALDYLTKRHDLPRIRFVNDLGLSVLEPMRRGWMNALRPRTPDGDCADLERAIAGGGSAALFLKRPPHVLEGRARGKIEGDHLILALFDLQRRRTSRALLVPQVFVWSRSAGTRGGNLVNSLFGPSEWPGTLRSVAQFLANRGRASLRAGEPVDLRDFLDHEAQGDGCSDDVLVRRLTYTLLRRLERERRAILGPARKPGDRLRHEVVHSPKLQKVIADMAGEGARERAVIAARATAMLRELQAELDMNAVAALDQVVSRAAARMFSAIEVDEPGIERLREHAKEGTLVLLPSHKSHMDYVALAWVLYHHKLPLPLVAAGDNLNFFPVGRLFRRAGAFFIRRTFAGDRLYAAVVDAYVRRMIRDGSALEFFLEGGRSRTGKLLPPKLGLLSLVVDAALSVPTRTTWFCPVSIGYERFVEEKAFVHELSGGEKERENVRGLVRSMDVMVGRYGRLSVQFGRPLNLTDILRELDERSTREDLGTMSPTRRRAVITRLAYRVMNEINAVTAVTAGPLVATALLAHDRRGLPQSELLSICRHLARTLFSKGARFSPSLSTAGDPDIREAALREAADLFARAGNVEVRQVGGDVIYIVAPEARMSLDLAKNEIIHFFAPRALIATAVLAVPGPPVPFTSVRERVLALSRLFKFEFTFRADAPFERIFDEEVAAMEAEGEIDRMALKTGDADVRVVPKGETGLEQIVLYARLLDNFLEGYRIAARGLTSLLRGPLTTKEVVRRAITAGERMFLAGEIAKREAVSRPLIENAYSSFVDQGYVSRAGDKIALTESYETPSAVSTIEARITAMSAPHARTP
ncbi:MAG TPA: 1-acyl-sn-glycerol-3-phosphate acyltransferase [Polyangiaceae bacterium]|nr:1-acyl-sn-glycerol-3-phosphate acyltransferase [Polyangiaceae bacterium]